jgi:hypothetical protein
MAAWLMIKLGEKEKGLNCLEEMLKIGSYTQLEIPNILDGMGDDAKPAIGTIESFTPVGQTG